MVFLRIPFAGAGGVFIWVARGKFFRSLLIPAIQFLPSLTQEMDLVSDLRGRSCNSAGTTRKLWDEWFKDPVY